MTIVRIKPKTLEQYFLKVLHENEVRADVSNHLVKGIIQASLRGIDSHGIRLFPHYLEGFKQGRLNKNPNYEFKKTSAATGVFDANHAPGHAAGMEAMEKAIDLAKTSGVGAVSVFNSSHFGAAAYFAFRAAAEDMIGLSFTQATAHVAPYNGIKPFFGNNPFCLVAPCADEDPFCLDMATTTATFNKVQAYAEMKEKIPDGWGIDKYGNKTNEPSKVLSLLPIGGYKGFGLSMALEIFCSLLTGMEYGPAITAMFGNSMSDKRKLGHFFIAINIANFIDPTIFKVKLKKMMDDLRKEPNDGKTGILAPGDPEKITLKKRKKLGLPVDAKLLQKFDNLSTSKTLNIT